MKDLPIDRYLQEGDNDFLKRAARFYQHIEPRLVMNDFLLKEKEENFVPVSEAQMDEIKAYWKKFLPDLDIVNLDHYCYYAAMCKDASQLKYYIPDSFFYAFIDEYFTNPIRSQYVDDKQFYDMFFHDCKVPETICRKVDDIFFDSEFNQIDLAKFIEICENEEEVIIKKSMYSYGGKNILFWNKSMGRDKLVAFLYDDHIVGKLLERKCKQYVVQKIIKQHETLSYLNPTSVNTIRVITLLHDGKFHALSSVMRMGVDGRVDNCSSGGIVAGINPDGTLKDVAYDHFANPYHIHPRGVQFAGVKVPSCEKCVELALKLAKRFCSASRMISWDFAISEDGEPIVIEMNISYGEIDFHQMCNGPIFGDMTDAVIEEVCENSFDLRYLNHDV